MNRLKKALQIGLLILPVILLCIVISRSRPREFLALSGLTDYDRITFCSAQSLDTPSLVFEGEPLAALCGALRDSRFRYERENTGTYPAPVYTVTFRDDGGRQSVWLVDRDGLFYTDKAAYRLEGQGRAAVYALLGIEQFQ